MSNSKELSTIEIVNRGWLLVNIPSIIIILVVWFCLATFVDLSNGISILIGTSLGWLYWEYSIKKWVRWALDNNVEPERLLKIGQFSLLLWNSRQIDEILNEKK